VSCVYCGGGLGGSASLLLTPVFRGSRAAAASGCTPPGLVLS
jgi:hypothetical protein